jgi:hypothetical protein
MNIKIDISSHVTRGAEHVSLLKQLCENFSIKPNAQLYVTGRSL